MTKSARLFLLLTSLVALAGCSIFESADDRQKEKEHKAEKAALKERKELEAETKPICPQVAIVRELEAVRDYGGEKTAPDQLVSAARMNKISGNCAYQDKGIDIKFQLDMEAARGPRLGGLHANIPYFIAVVDPSGAILNKDRMTVDMRFSSDEMHMFHQEVLHVFIPLAKNQQRSGPNYQVLAGFQLTQQQLDETMKGKPAN